MNKTGEQFRESFGRSFQVKLLRTLYQQPSQLALVRHTVKIDYYEDKLLQWFAGKLYYAFDKKYRATKMTLIRDLSEAVNYGVIEADEKKEYRAFVRKLARPVSEGNWISAKIGDFVRQARLKSGIMKTAVALDEEKNTDKAIEELSLLQTDLRSDLGMFDPSEFSRFTHNYIENGPTKLSTGITTGLDSLDRAMGGHRGMPPRRLGVIMANSGSGKTLTLTHLGATALRTFAMRNDDRVILHLTGEDDADSMAMRYLAAILGVPFKMLKRKKFTEDVRRKYRIVSKTLGKRWEDRLVVREIDADEMSVDQVDGMLQLLKSIGRPVGMLIVDYADLLKPRKIKEDSYSHIGNIYKELRDLCKNERIPGWTASQVGRMAQGKKILTVKDIEGSMKKVFTADVVLALQQTDKEKLRGRGRMTPLKIRFGRDKFEFPVQIDYPKQRLIDEEQSG